MISPTARNPEQSLLHTVTAATAAVNPLLICLMTNTDDVIKAQGNMQLQCLPSFMGRDFLWKGWTARVPAWNFVLCSVCKCGSY